MTTGAAGAGDLLIREAAVSEYDAVGELTVEAYRTIDPDLGAYEAELRDVARHAGGATILVAIRDGRVVGTVTYVGQPGSPLSETADPIAADIRMLAVDRRASGRGIGTALVVRCIELARADERKRLLLLTRESMTAAQRLYARLGFARVPWMDKGLGGGRRLLGYALELDES